MLFPLLLSKVRRGSGTKGQRPVNFLLEGETCVCYFVGLLVLSQPKISRRLAYLRRSFLPAARGLDALQASRGSMMILLAANPRLRPCHAPLGNGPKTSTGENPDRAGFLGTPSGRTKIGVRPALYARVSLPDQTFATNSGIVEAAIQVAPRPRKGMIPPE